MIDENHQLSDLEKLHYILYNLTGSAKDTIAETATKMMGKR